MQPVTRTQVQMMKERGARLVEVLSEDAYRDFHLPDAINVPLGDDFDERIRGAIPDKAERIIVYCKDIDCDASPRAGRRMEELGYQNVYDYEAGKEDWEAAGLPTE